MAGGVFMNGLGASVATPFGDPCLNGYGFVSQKWWIGVM